MKLEEIPEEDRKKLKCDHFKCGKLGEFGTCYMHAYIHCERYYDDKTKSSRKES